MLFNRNIQNGFSLIELSIVLIIIGLLVAGITGGASLINSAKIISYSKEFNNYKQTYFIFRVKTGRLPGDANNDWKIDFNEVYTASSFPAPYNVAPRIPNATSGPWVDLYLEGVTDFEPKGNTGDQKTTAKNGGAPSSKPFPEMYYAFGYYSGYPETHYSYPLSINMLYSQSFDDTKAITAKNVLALDKKMDDGTHNTGSIRGLCYNSVGASQQTYTDSINSGLKSGSLSGRCSRILYVIE